MLNTAELQDVSPNINKGYLIPLFYRQGKLKSGKVKRLIHPDAKPISKKWQINAIFQVGGCVQCK